MATSEIVNTISHDSKRVIEGKNGGKLTPFNSDTARLAVKAREEKRMRLYAEGAGLATIDQSLIAKYGEDAHIVERAKTMQEIATTPDAGKAAVMAAQHLDKAQGLTPDKATGDTAQALAQGFGVVLGQMLDALTQGLDAETLEAIEGEVTGEG